MENLWEEFDCKFTLFIPSNYHNKYPLSKYTDWVNYWLDKEWVELAAHGHYHQCKMDGIGEQEFLELNYKEATDRIMDSHNEWQSCGYFPKGFRMPGWGYNPESGKAVNENYKYIALHDDDKNNSIFIDCRNFYGHDGIHQTDSIQVCNNTFMFHSHIAGDWNDNIWNEKNYENFRNILSYLEKNYKLSYKTIGELI